MASVQLGSAQTTPVSALPAGRYETVNKSSQDKWERGDIILMSDNKYSVSSTQEVGEYRFSVTAQRIFFTSGPLKSLYARTSLGNDKNPVIVLPVPENEQMGLKLSSEVWCYYRH